MVTLPEHSSAAIKAFLEFCYSGRYLYDGLEIGYDVQPAIKLDLELYQFADYILAPKLKIKAGKKLRRHVFAPYDKGAKESYRKFWEEVLPGMVKKWRIRIRIWIRTRLGCLTEYLVMGRFCKDGGGNGVLWVRNCVKQINEMEVVWEKWI